MKIPAVRRIVMPALAAIAGVAAMFVVSVDASQETAPSKPARKGVVIRGCLNGSKLTRLDPQQLEPADLVLKLPDTLKVTSVRVIRDQVKALNGHQVEVTGALRGIPGMETGVLVADSDNAKL